LLADLCTHAPYHGLMLAFSESYSLSRTQTPFADYTRFRGLKVSRSIIMPSRFDFSFTSLGFRTLSFGSALASLDSVPMDLFYSLLVWRNRVDGIIDRNRYL
jgi:hypothetical protein